MCRLTFRTFRLTPAPLTFQPALPGAFADRNRAFTTSFTSLRARLDRIA
jgi:hypothetical protein